MKNLFRYSFPSSVSRKFGLRFVVLTNWENASVFGWAYLFFKGTVQPILPKLSKTAKFYLCPFLFEGPYSFTSYKYEDQVSLKDLIIVLIVSYFFLAGVLYISSINF